MPNDITRSRVARGAKHFASRCAALVLICTFLATSPSWERTGFHAVDGPVPANSRGLYWRSHSEPWQEADIEIWRFDGATETQVGVFRMPTKTALGYREEAIIRPTSGWSVGDRYRFVYRGDRHLQKVEVTVDEAVLQPELVARFVSAKISAPFVERTSGCLSHCENREISAVIAELDLGEWERFRSQLVLGIIGPDGKHSREPIRRNYAQLLARDCEKEDPEVPERFWLAVTHPAVRGQTTGLLAPVEVPNVCADGPVIESGKWPAAVRDVAVGEKPPAALRSKADPRPTRSLQRSEEADGSPSKNSKNEDR